MYPFAQGVEKWSRSGTGTDDTATRTDSRPRRIFVTDDKFPDVIRALRRRGWTRSSDANSPDFDLKWRNLSNINFRLLRKEKFVNHVFNSQQLSNKALLTCHLAFQHDHQRRQQQQQQQQQRQQLLEGPGGSEHGGGVDSVFSSPFAWSAPGRGVSDSNGPSQGQACNNASDPIPPTAAATAWKASFQAADPEAFFPRCWDVSDNGDGVCSMLRAFAVSAAVALLRTAVNAEVTRRARMAARY
ncbi:unnamed protein product [Ectocarpus sp. 4 AP-2014]